MNVMERAGSSAVVFINACFQIKQLPFDMLNGCIGNKQPINQPIKILVPPFINSSAN